MGRFGLGTAQFEARYGISNRVGQPDEAEVAAILARAAAAGIGYLDTAASYGASESLIGKHLPRRHRLRIVTKLPPVAGEVIERCHGSALLDGIGHSLGRMKIDQLYGVLVHAASDLAKPGWEHLVETMREAQSRGWVARIGASIYNASELELTTGRFKPELVQLPFNAMDNRLVVSGWLSRLKSMGTEIHARSVFLQGLLLMDPATIPKFFGPALEGIGDLRARWAANGLTPLAGCFHFVFQHPAIDVAIVGVNRVSELQELEAVVARIDDSQPSIEPPRAVDERYLDPRQWPATVN